jgi:predicted esterase
MMIEGNGASAARPHRGQPVLTAGEDLARARAAMVLLHGRGGTARDILTLVQHLEHPGFAFLAPEAAGNVWYPQRFTVPVENNQPWLSSALDLLAGLVERITASGVPADRVILAGFSQGACLSLEFAARTPKRYGGILGFSGGLIGPLGAPRDLHGSLEGTPVFLGCSDVDPHIPIDYVRESGEVMRRLGADVTERIYPGFGHSINSDELAFARDLMARVGALSLESSPDK